MKIAAILFTIGVLFVGYAMTLSPYTDKELFMERMEGPLKCTEECSYCTHRSECYQKLRTEMLTPKYKLIDYGGTLIVAAFLIALMVRKGRLQVLLTGSQKVLIAMAFALPFLSGAAMVFDALQAMERFVTPPWADAGETNFIAATPVLVVIMLIWSFIHILIFGKSRQPAKILTSSLISTANWWLLFNSAFAAILDVLFALAGFYWFFVVGCAWAYFYLSLATARCHVKTEQG